MTGWLMTAVLAFIVVAGIVSYVIGIYNGLIQAKNNIQKAFNNIDVLLQQRHDELPKLVDAAKGYLKHEQDLLDNVVRLRTRYRNGDDMAAKIHAENRLAELMDRFNVQVEQYPDLKAIASFSQVQARVSALEEQIADRRELFNDSVNIFNIRIERFPDLMLARLLNYTRQAFLRVPDGKKEDVVLGFAA